jgi:hypothetical protein
LTVQFFFSWDLRNIESNERKYREERKEKDC